MPGYAYLDASALVKLSVRERETTSLEHALLDRDALFSSVLSATELTRAVRRSGHQALLQHVEAVLSSIFLVDVTAAICDHAGRLDPVTLRSVDAIHVATAISLSLPGLAFITYDDRQADAGRTCGLRVLQPGR